MPLHGIGQTPIKTGAYRTFVLSKLGDDGLLPFLHDENLFPTKSEQQSRDQAHTNAGILHIRLVSATVTGSASASIFSAKNLTTCDSGHATVHPNLAVGLLIWDSDHLDHPSAAMADVHHRHDYHRSICHHLAPSEDHSD